MRFKRSWGGERRKREIEFGTGVYPRLSGQGSRGGEVYIHIYVVRWDM